MMPVTTLTLTAADVALHQRLGITTEWLEAAKVRRVDDREARELLNQSRRPGSLAGIVYPYVDPRTQRAVTYRVRRDNPEIEDGKPKQKYLSPHGDRSHLYFPPDCSERLTDTTTSVIIVEAEKSVLSVMCAADRVHRAVLAIGLGGCWGWRGRIGKTTDANGSRVDEVGALPDLDLITWTDRDVVIAFDVNAFANPKVQAARCALTKELSRAERGAKVRIVELPRA